MSRYTLSQTSVRYFLSWDNGAGKTTLLRMIAEELLARTDIHAAYMPQNYEDLLNLETNPVDYLARTGDKEELTQIRTFLGSLKYTFEKKMADSSSGIWVMSSSWRSKRRPMLFTAFIQPALPADAGRRKNPCEGCLPARPRL